MPYTMLGKKLIRISNADARLIGRKQCLFFDSPFVKGGYVRVCPKGKKKQAPKGFKKD